MRNRRDAFSHSQPCDELNSSPVVTHPGLSRLVLGQATAVLVNLVPANHAGCLCWCHHAEQLFNSPEPEYDLTPPPEYLSSADRAFVLDEPAHVRVGFSKLTDLAEPLSSDLRLSIDEYGPTSTIRGAVVLDSRLNEIAARPDGDLIKRFPRRSTLELATGKCDTCGDKLADCECVE